MLEAGQSVSKASVAGSLLAAVRLNLWGLGATLLGLQARAAPRGAAPAGPAAGGAVAGRGAAARMLRRGPGRAGAEEGAGAPCCVTRELSRAGAVTREHWSNAHKSWQAAAWFVAVRARVRHLV